MADPPKRLFGLWLAGKSSAGVGKQVIGTGCPIVSWYCIMPEMGIFPDKDRLRPAGANAHYDMEEVDNLLQRSAMILRDPAGDVLLDMPRKQNEKSLQLYFW